MSNQPAKSLISFDNVNKSYSGKSAVKNLTFSIAENEFVGLIGNNGCGKTTTINILCNLTPYESGRASILGSRITPGYSSYKKNLGIVLSTHYSIDTFSVTDYLSFVGEFQSLKKKQIKERIEDLLVLLELQNESRKAIKDLSSGNKMKVSLAAALIHNPRILILDEPFVNLDIKSTQTISEILKSFKGKKTVLITSHNLDLVVELCDRFLLMETGTIIAQVENHTGLTSEELKQQIKSHLSTNPGILKEITWLN